MAEETLRHTWLKDNEDVKIAPNTLATSVYTADGTNISEVMLTQNISGSSYNYTSIKTNADQLVKAQTAELPTSEYINSKNIVKYGDLVADTEGYDSHYDSQVLTLEEISAATDIVSLYGKLPTASSLYVINNIVGTLNNKLAIINKPEFKDITSDFDDMAKFRANLDKYHVGNYIRKGNYLIMLADYDYFYGGYDSYATINTHHWVGLVFGCGTHTMNSTNTTANGYSGSAMHSWLKSTIMPSLQSVFGSDRFIKHQKLLTTNPSAWGWQADQYISLPSEIQIYGSTVGSNSLHDTGEANRHLELFKHNSFMEIFNKGDSILGLSTFRSSHAWLRDISAASASSNFCLAANNGNSDYYGASTVFGAFPLVIIA